MIDIIKTQDLHFSYSTPDGASPVVLDGVDLNIEKGSFVAVLGHNGSGKSTLAKHLNAILLPSGGKVYVNGVDTADEAKLLDIRRTVGMVFQNPDNQIVANVVEEDVAFAPENLGVPPEEIRRRVDDALKAVGMYEFREHAPHLLSGGQKQRIAIAGVIAMQPECIVLDEPTAMLDPIGRSDVMRTIKQLNREKGVTVVIITHHMDEAAQADRLVVMAKGKVVADGTPKEVFQDVEGLKAIGLTVPDALKAVGMYEFREHAPHLLSGGQKQRIAIAGVIAMQPECIVLDEPTAMLDPIGRSDVMRTIKQLNREKGVTVVIITHHMDEAAQADRLVVMAKGKVVADGTPKEVFQDVEGLKAIGLTVPDTTELMYQLNQCGLDAPLDALSDEECAQALMKLLNP